MIEFEKKKSAHKNSKILVEKYRPQTVKHVILPKRFKKMFKSFIEEQEIQNIIIHSQSPGSGKTTIAKALANDCGYDYIYINASMHGGISTLRDDIATYASCMGIAGKKKVVILDEFDFASKSLQAGLRGAIEEFYDQCRFIFTANNVNQIISPLRSRCMVMNFDFTENDKHEVADIVEKRLGSIAKNEDIEYEEGIMGKIVTAFYPDIRKMISSVGEYSRLYGVIDENIFKWDEIDNELKDIIISLDHKNARQFILNNGYRYEDLYRYVYDEIIPVIDSGIKGHAYIMVAEYMDMSTRSTDQEITFSGFLASLMDLMGGD